jgi:hypothetical protein
MKNYIIGSGIIGLLAKKLFPDWEIIAQKRSRFYSFNPALADNFIVYSKDIEEKLKNIGINGSISEYKSPFSITGQLMYQENEFLVVPYLTKVYGDNYNPVAKELIKTLMHIYSIPVSKLYYDLQNEIIKSDKKVDPLVVSKIDMENRRIYVKSSNSGNRVLDYDNIICTCPLDAINKWVDVDQGLESKDICYYHIQTKGVDLEGAHQAYVVDESIEFFKVNRIKGDEWLFWSFDRIDNPHNYFGLYLGFTLNIIDSFRIEGAIPIGPPPDLKHLEKNGIFCVGSNAQWDDMMDISSCINRLYSIKGKNG